jgi:hypothetical protein
MEFSLVFRYKHLGGTYCPLLHSGRAATHVRLRSKLLSYDFTIIRTRRQIVVKNTIQNVISSSPVVTCRHRRRDTAILVCAVLQLSVANGVEEGYNGDDCRVRTSCSIMQNGMYNKLHI